ncbi:MAG: hypothetical protein PVS2B1_24180 [Candidatus Dormibacteraceae bacterium]
MIRDPLRFRAPALRAPDPASTKRVGVPEKGNPTEVRAATGRLLALLHDELEDGQRPAPPREARLIAAEITVLKKSDPDVETLLEPPRP